MVDHLRAQLAQDRIILVGHSWGAALALLYAYNHPEKVAAAVAVAPLISGLEGERAQYDFVETEARRHSDVDVLDQLAKFGKPPFPKTIGTSVEDLVDKYGGVFHARPNYFLVTIEGVLKGYVSPFEIGNIIRGNYVTLEAMHDEIDKLDLRKAVPELKVPVVFILGRFDRQADARIASDYFWALRAPNKALIWFEGSAHNIPFEQPGLFNERLTHALSAILCGPNDSEPGAR